jgi:selT/selW/selH-like putative selenoprotein
VGLANEVLTRWAPIMRSVGLDSSTKGRFEVTLDGELVFSKSSAGRHAAAGEVVELLEKKLGPAIHWRDDSA